jgi:PAS domain S-box-containing protein
MLTKVDKSEIFSSLYLATGIISSITILLIIISSFVIAYFFKSSQSKIIQELYIKEKELWQKEERFKVSIDSIGEGVIICDIEGNIEYLNSRAEELTGWNNREARGRALSEVYYIRNEETGQIETNILEKVFKQGIVKELANHTILISKSGQELAVMDTGAPIFGQDGKAIGVVITFQDETEKRKQQRLIKENEARLNRAEKIAKLGNWELDIQTNIPVWSLQTYRIHEIDPSVKPDIEGAINFYAPEARPIITEAINRCIQEGKPWDLELPFITAKGKHIWVRAIGEAEFHDGKCIRLFGTFQDITERKLAEQELILLKEKAESNVKLKTAFLGNISHEIRTPMIGIIGFSKVLSEGNLSKSERKEYAEEIKKSSDRLLSLLNDIIQVSKLETGQINIENSEFNLNNLIEELYSNYLDKASNKKLEFIFSIDLRDEESEIISDEQKIEQIFSVLLDNSLKFTDHGSIKFGYIARETEFEFFVKDSGIGISEEFLPNIFDFFAQENIALNRSYEGAGIGLSIAKGLIELLGGRIWVETQKGIGSTFYFTLPRIQVNG